MSRIMLGVGASATLLLAIIVYMFYHSLGQQGCRSCAGVDFSSYSFVTSTPHTIDRQAKNGLPYSIYS